MQRFFSTQFLSLLLIKMLIPAMATGGIAIEVGANSRLESAHINSINAIEVCAGEAGSGIECSNEVMVCECRPCIAVALSAMKNFEHLPLAQLANAINYMEQAWLRSDVKLPDLTLK